MNEETSATRQQSSTSTTSAANVLNPGQLLVQRLERDWSMIHQNSQHIGTRAQVIDQILNQMHKSVTMKQKELKSCQNTLNNTLPQLKTTVETMYHQTRQLYQLYEQLNLVLLFAQSKQMESAFLKWQQQEESQLKLFAKQKNQELLDHVQKLEREKQEMRENARIQQLQNENEQLRQELLQLKLQRQQKQEFTAEEPSPPLFHMEQQTPVFNDDHCSNTTSITTADMVAHDKNKMSQAFIPRESVITERQERKDRKSVV